MRLSPFCAALISAVFAETSSPEGTNEVPAATQPRFTRFFTIVFENTDFNQTMQLESFKTLATYGRLYSHFRATAHPSQPNYLAMISGSDYGLLTDEVVRTDATSIVDRLEAKNLTWKAYQENYPGNCWTGKGDGIYERKHNPFMSFDNIRNNPERCAKIVNSEQLQKDIENKSVPNYVFYTPNQIHDMHGTPGPDGVYPKATAENNQERMHQGDLFVAKFLEPLFTNPYFEDTLFFVTFDENDVVFAHEPESEHGTENIIYTLAIGAGVEAGTVDNADYTHYSQLSLLQQEWGLESLGRNDTDAVPLALSSAKKTVEEVHETDAEETTNGAFASNLVLSLFPLAYLLL